MKMTMSMKKHISRVLIAIVCLVILYVYAMPMLLLLLNSVKNQSESAIMSFTLPKEWMFQNFVNVLKKGNIIRAFLNGALIATSITAITILVSALSAYTIVRRNDRTSKIVYSYLIAGMIAPFSFVPAIKLLQMLNLYGSYSGIILIDCAIQIPFTVLMFSGFIKVIPRELDEAAIIDGSGPLRQFFQIIMPTLKPAVSTNVILLFTFGWNDFQNILFLMPDSKKWTMPMSVFNFQGLYTYNYGMVCANMLISIIPILIVYICTQSYIISGMTAGAVKG